MYKKILLVFVGFIGTAALSSCSVWMEAHRPTPTNLNQFTVGESRADILTHLGKPMITVPGPNGERCDVYHLYTRGVGPGGKAAIAFGEGAADVLTIGLSELIFTPVQGATKDHKHPVSFCYKHSKLVRVKISKSASSG